MTKIKSVKELSLEAHMAALKQSIQGKELGELTSIGIGHVSSIVTNTISHDRLSHKEAIVEAFGSQQECKSGCGCTGHESYHVGGQCVWVPKQYFTVEEAIAIVNSIYDEE